MPYIEFKNITKQYKMGEVKINALNNTNFEINKGELVVIVGPSGAGKTTALNILGGMDTATSGKVIVDNKEITKLTSKQLVTYRRNDIGFVFQFYNLVQNLTAKENVELATQLCKDALNVDDILTKVGLENRKDNFPSQLSGGEQQRVALARALVNNPSMIIADEPTGNLDPKTSEEIMKLLEQINDRGTTVLVVTHNKEIVNAMKKRVVTMHEGSIISDEKEGEYHEA